MCPLENVLKNEMEATKWVSLFYNITTHKTGKTIDILKKLVFEHIDISSYSSNFDQSLSCFHPLSVWKGDHLQMNQMIAAAEQDFDSQTSESYGWERVKETCEMICQVCWTLEWLYGRACTFYDWVG